MHLLKKMCFIFIFNNSDFEKIIKFVVPVIVCSCLVCVVFILNISHRSWRELNEGITNAAESVSCVGMEKGHNAVFANVMHATWFPWTLSGGFVPKDGKLAHTTAQCRINPVTSHNYITMQQQVQCFSLSPGSQLSPR